MRHAEWMEVDERVKDMTMSEKLRRPIMFHANPEETNAERRAAADRIDRLSAALTRIEKWFGEFPPTDRYWDKKKQEPMSYAAAFGSNGERDFMRGVARAALMDEQRTGEK